MAIFPTAVDLVNTKSNLLEWTLNTILHLSCITIIIFIRVWFTLIVCRKWRLKANVSKTAVMAFGKGFVEGSWKWGE